MIATHRQMRTQSAFQALSRVGGVTGSEDADGKHGIKGVFRHARVFKSHRDDGFGQHHFDGGYDQYRRANIDNLGKAFRIAQDKRATPNYDGDADQSTQYHEPITAVRCAGDGEDVVDSHHRIGDHNGLHRRPKTARRRDVVV